MQKKVLITEITIMVISLGEITHLKSDILDYEVKWA